MMVHILTTHNTLQEGFGCMFKTFTTHANYSSYPYYNFPSMQGDGNGLCVQSKSNFLTQDNFFKNTLSIPIGAIYLICIFLSHLISMTRWQPIKHVAIRLLQVSVMATLMVELS
jgi:hypothetical protein